MGKMMEPIKLSNFEGKYDRRAFIKKLAGAAAAYTITTYGAGCTKDTGPDDTGGGGSGGGSGGSGGTTSIDPRNNILVFEEIYNYIKNIATKKYTDFDAAFADICEKIDEIMRLSKGNSDKLLSVISGNFIKSGGVVNAVMNPGGAVTKGDCKSRELKKNIKEVNANNYTFFFSVDCK